MTTVAHVINNLCYAARLIEPAGDWRWLAAIKARLAALARPEDRFDRLIPPWQILDLGIELIEEALKAPSDRYKRREILYRDGLLLALLSLWPIRRRSITALTVSRHLQFDPDGVHILLYPEDTKAKRAESFRVPEPLLANLMHYLKVIRPRLMGRNTHDGLWASYRGRPLSADRLYDIVRARLWGKFGKFMSLHDIRRSAAYLLGDRCPRPGWSHPRGPTAGLAGNGRTALQFGQIGQSHPSIRCILVQTSRQAAAGLDKKRKLTHACRHLRQI